MRTTGTRWGPRLMHFAVWLAVTSALPIAAMAAPSTTTRPAGMWRLRAGAPQELQVIIDQQATQRELALTRVIRQFDAVQSELRHHQGRAARGSVARSQVADRIATLTGELRELREERERIERLEQIAVEGYLEATMLPSRDPHRFWRPGVARVPTEDVRVVAVIDARTAVLAPKRWVAHSRPVIHEGPPLWVSTPMRLIDAKRIVAVNLPTAGLKPGDRVELPPTLIVRNLRAVTVAGTTTELAEVEPFTADAFERDEPAATPRVPSR